MFIGKSLAWTGCALAALSMFASLPARAEDTFCYVMQDRSQMRGGEPGGGDVPLKQGCTGITLESGQSFRDIALDASTDGRAKAGFRVLENRDPNSPPPMRARMWLDGRAYELGTLGGDMSVALAVSRRGAVVVGQSEDGRRNMRAFRWTRRTGMQTIEEWLGRWSRDGRRLRGWTLQSAVAVNKDGSVVHGLGMNRSGEATQWVARRGSGLIGLGGRDGLGGSLGRIVDLRGFSLSQFNVFLHGLHGRPAQRRKGARRWCAWSAGDVGHDGWKDRDDLFGLGEIGLCWRPSDDVVVSLSVGGRWLKRKTELGGGVRQNGIIGMAEIQARMGAPLGAPLWLIGSLSGGWADTRIRRGYLNGGWADISTGDTDIRDIGFRGRFEWEGAARTGVVSWTPFAEFSVSHSRMDGYTEHGGGFPARFSAMSETVHELRGGLDLQAPLNERVSLHATLQGVHRFEKRGKGMTGEVMGLFAFGTQGRKYRRDWLRGGIGLDFAAGPGILSVTMNATTKGEAPTLWGNIGYQVNF